MKNRMDVPQQEYEPVLPGKVKAHLAKKQAQETEKEMDVFEHLGKALFLATHDIFLHFHRPRIYRRDAQWEKIDPEDREFFINAAEKHFTNLIIDSEEETTH